MIDLSLETRDGLPDSLRVLLETYPRTGWTQDPGFDGLIRFWLDRHVMFRRLLQEMQDSSADFLDRRIDAETHASKVSRYGGMFVQQLHEHHTIEDVHYFPKLAGLDARIERGFEILDADHHALDGHLKEFVEAANGYLQNRSPKDAARKAAGAFDDQTGQLEKLLDRHLTDEEDLIVPVILKYGSAGLG